MLLPVSAPPPTWTYLLQSLSAGTVRYLPTRPLFHSGYRHSVLRYLPTRALCHARYMYWHSVNMSSTAVLARYPVLRQRAVLRNVRYCDDVRGCAVLCDVWY